jgi:hypothetical protein
LFGLGHALQLMALPHVSVAEPHSMFCCAHVFGAQPHRPGVTAPHDCGAWQLFVQLMVPPHPLLSAAPHRLPQPWGAQHVPPWHTPPPVQLHVMVPPQLSLNVPHSPAAHVRRWQQVRLPTAPMHTRPEGQPQVVERLHAVTVVPHSTPVQLGGLQHVPAVPFVVELQTCGDVQGQLRFGRPGVGFGSAVPHCPEYALAHVAVFVAHWFVCVLQTCPPVHAVRQLIVPPHPSARLFAHCPG